MQRSHIGNKIRTIINSSLRAQTQNIKYELAKRALESTANYVENNMNKLISVDTKYKVHDIASDTVTVENGIVLEFGVYKADSINYIAKKLNKLDIYGFDSFEGLEDVKATLLKAAKATCDFYIKYTSSNGIPY